MPATCGFLHPSVPSGMQRQGDWRRSSPPQPQPKTVEPKTGGGMTDSKPAMEKGRNRKNGISDETKRNRN